MGVGEEGDEGVRGGGTRVALARVFRSCAGVRGDFLKSLVSCMVVGCGLWIWTLEEERGGGGI